MKRKNQNKFHHARVVTLIIVFTNIYQISSPQSIQGINTFENTMPRPVLSCFTKRGRKLFSVKRNLFIQGNICESRKRNNKIL